ncbi:MAG TPA: FxLYD domain-containing protein [Slackia equolifaciens]|uniref:FxLYD domain-containing protein n=1 Tax=Slackia equolifaciens TaxID=498718 RepID=A0A9D3A0L8_9ACTN|nr:FxLYD domain-containing protein [Slackia equolifaciens]
MRLGNAARGGSQRWFFEEGDEMRSGAVMRHLGHSLLVAFAIAAIAVFLSGCAQQQPEEGPDYADDEVMAAIASGLEDRFALADKYEESGAAQTVDELIEVTQVEIDAIAPFRERQFEDPKLQEAVLSYANLLDEMKVAAESGAIDDWEFIEEWDKLYGERSTTIKEFVDTWGLSVDSAYESDLDGLLRNATSVEEDAQEKEAVDQLVSSMEFAVEDDGYGSFYYTATVENDSGLDFGDFSVVLALYDEDGVKVEEAYAGTSSWAQGEKVKFETIAQTKASEIKVSVSYYDLANE